jgi:type VI secretion system protein VasD
VLLTMTIAVNGCSSKPPKPTVVELTISADKDVNQTSSGRASPIRLRIHHLTSERPFVEADYYRIVKAGSEALGDSLVKGEEIVLDPDTRQTIVRTLDAKVKFIGFVADYQDIDNAVWSVIVPVADHRTNIISVKLGRLAISVESSEK